MGRLHQKTPKSARSSHFFGRLHRPAGSLVMLQLDLREAGKSFLGQKKCPRNYFPRFSTIPTRPQTFLFGLGLDICYTMPKAIAIPDVEKRHRKAKRLAGQEGCLFFRRIFAKFVCVWRCGRGNGAGGKWDGERDREEGW